MRVSQGYEPCIAIVTRHFKFASLNPRWDFRAVKQSKYLLSKATAWELASYMNTKQNQREEREGVKGDLFHCKYFRAFFEVVWGLSEPLENSGTVRQANANPSPIATCLSVSRADNVDFFYLPSLLSCFLPFVSAV